MDGKRVESLLRFLFSVLLIDGPIEEVIISADQIAEAERGLAEELITGPSHASHPTSATFPRYGGRGVDGIIRRKYHDFLA